jgi:MOSC domain-containing protein YiiM
MMRVVSLNVGLPRTMVWRGREVRTGIFKQPVAGPTLLGRSNLDGDRQADLENHGGRVKAVYAYPAEHYEFWRAQLPEAELPWSMFGENFTTEGLDEEDTYIGDRFQVGPVAEIMVTQPRIACYKLGMKFGRDDIVARFLRSGRSGIYFSVVKEGMVGAGSTIKRVHRDENGITVADINRACANGSENVSLMRQALRLKWLPAGIRDQFVRQLSSINSQ